MANHGTSFCDLPTSCPAGQFLFVDFKITAGRLYIQEERKVIDQSKDGKAEKVFDALEWLRKRPRDQSLGSHVFSCRE